MTSFEMDHLDDDQKQRLLLESRYKPIFDRHEHEGGVPLKSLRQEMEEVGGSKLPRGKMELLLRRADEDQDGKLEFGEFIRIMTAETGDRQLTAFQKLLKISLNGVIPRNAQKKRMEYYLDHYNCCPPPLFMIFISLAEIGVFVFYAIELKGMGVETTASSGFPWYSPLIYKPQRRYEAWRFLTYMFIHVGYLHLVFNLIMQLMLGLPLEMVHKWWRVGFVYSLGVVAGSLGHSVVDTTTMLAGASGGCYALIGAQLAAVIMNWKEMTRGCQDGVVEFISSAPVRLTLILVLGGADTGLAIYQRFTGDSKGSVGFAAHFGGFLAGLLLGISVLKNIDKKPWETVLWWISTIIYCILIIFCICWNGFYPGFPDQDWRPCCPIT